MQQPLERYLLLSLERSVTGKLPELTSIKDNERDKRDADGERASKFHITGPNQTRPLNFLEALRNDDFKRAYIKTCNEQFTGNIYTSI